MAYSELVGGDNYDAKYAGAAIEIILQDNDTGEAAVGHATNHNINSQFEQVEIEESGKEGTDQIATGRHNVRGSMGAFWTPEWNDNLPTREDFIGKSYTIFEKIAPGRPNAGEVVNVVEGVKLTGIDKAQQPRGAKTFNVSYVATRHYTGAQWAALAGS